MYVGDCDLRDAMCTLETGDCDLRDAMCTLETVI